MIYDLSYTENQKRNINRRSVSPLDKITQYHRKCQQTLQCSQFVFSAFISRKISIILIMCPLRHQNHYAIH